ncbi:MAG: formate dehydrogenase subunit gamma [Gammaproteobacteria bacterium]|nr:formate dehydrogenase subunit gamma [Gammaproteobacteria bacterium]
MNDKDKRGRRGKQLLTWGGFSLLVVLLLPLVPYAIQAATGQNGNTAKVVNPIDVPSPGAELWREVRQRDGVYVGTTQVQGVDTGVLINKTGEDWRLYRMTELVPYGAILMGLILGAILLFYFIRGRIRVPGGFSGKMILRFTLSERMVHWFTAIIFWLLGITGLILLYGRFVLIPLLGPAGFSITASACKEAHNLFGPLFLFAMLALFITFVKDNFYARGDLKWLLKGGGMFGGHVSAGRFNAGEKIWFWLATVLGFALCITGLVLDFAVFGQGRDVMALSHIIHSISAVVMIGVSFGHIYIGTAGMEGSFSSMANGYVDANWAKSHHDLWYEEAKHSVGAETPKTSVTAGGIAQARREI